MQYCRSAPQVETDDIDGLGQRAYPGPPGLHIMAPRYLDPGINQEISSNQTAKAGHIRQGSPPATSSLEHLVLPQLARTSCRLSKRGRRDGSECEACD